MKTNATITELKIALKELNKHFDGNIKFKRLDQSGNRSNFTLTVQNSSGPGGRWSAQGRKIAAACWHVHGHFFDILFIINPDTWINSVGRKVTKESGNWQDWNIGSQMFPFYYSQSCECGPGHDTIDLAEFKSTFALISR